MKAVYAVLLCFCLGCSASVQAPAELATNQNGPQAQDIDNLTDINKLVDRINEDDPPGRHFNYTPAVVELIARGPSVIPYVLPLMESDDSVTRIRAQQVLTTVSRIPYGFRFGKGWIDPDGENRWRQWWQELGDLRADSPKEDRIRAIKLWKVWLLNHQG